MRSCSVLSLVLDFGLRPTKTLVLEKDNLTVAHDCDKHEDNLTVTHDCDKHEDNLTVTHDCHKHETSAHHRWQRNILGFTCKNKIRNE